MSFTGTPCFEPATMAVYIDGQRIPMCSKHGSRYSEDTDRQWSQLRPSDPAEVCYWLRRAE